MPVKAGKQQTQQDHYSVAYLKNIQDVENKLGIKKGNEMTFLEANEGRGNPNFSKGGGYAINCQSCVVANELRRRGFDVSARENPSIRGSVIYQLAQKPEKVWIDENGNMPNAKRLSGYLYDVNHPKNRMKTLQEISKDFNDFTKIEGRYHISYFPRREYGNSWHIVTLERLSNGNIQIYDPQSGSIENWGLLANIINRGRGINVLRVDDLFVNTTIIKDIVVK